MSRIECGPLRTMASTPGPVARIAVRTPRAAGAVARGRVRTGARTAGAAVGMVRAPAAPVVRIVARGALLGSA
jgi:hypothetical protein